MDLTEIGRLTEDEARAFIEKVRWPNGPICVGCNSDQVYLLGGKTTRPGLYKCRSCKAQFTVKVGTIFEDSHIPLHKWLMAFHLMVSSKKGISAKQIQRNLGLSSYQSAWQMAHRVRHAMSNPGVGFLTGAVEVDETYVGGKPRKQQGAPKAPRGRGTKKVPVVALVQRQGSVRAKVIERVDSKTLKAAIRGIEQLPFGTVQRMGTTKAELLDDIKVHQIFGIDTEPRAARTAKMNMLMWGDGKNVSRGNALDNKDISGCPYPLSEYKERDQGSGCTLVLANPPFGSKEKDPEILKMYALRCCRKTPPKPRVAL
jgi:transposase-like protein